MFRTVGDRPSLWESRLPAEVLRLPGELARVVFLKFWYRLGYESLCAEVSDSVSWRRFCRIPLDGKVPHPTTLMKLTTRCGPGAVAGLNEALLAWAAGRGLLRAARVRADTTGSRRTWPTRSASRSTPRSSFPTVTPDLHNYIY
jgi:transposase, IS5 family